jgi:hypothetical protein
MSGSLSPVRERLAWGRERFEQLEAACDSFVTNQPDDAAPGFGVEINGQEGWWRLYANVPDPLPPALPRVVGEVLFHLRGSLDNLAWQLVLANNGSPDSKTEFPMFKDEPEFDKGAPRKMRGMSDTARAAIKGLQPFEAWPEYPDHSTLWKLHELNIIDKHRLPHLACLWLAHIKGQGVIGAGGRVAYTRKRGCLEDGADVLRLEWDANRTPDDTKMNVQFEASLDVAIHNPGQVEFIAGPNRTESAVPIRHLFQVGFNYLENTVIPAFEAEFA